MVLRLVVILGNICSGKSTIMKRLQSFYEEKSEEEVRIIMEPLDYWKPYLERFYEKMTSRSAFEMQLACFFHYFNIHQKLIKYEKSKKHVTVFVERSLWDSRNIFIENIKDVFSKEHLSILDTFCSLYINHPIWMNATYIYLECLDSSIIKERNIARGEQIPLSYLFQLNKLYQNCKHDYRIDTALLNEKETLKSILNILFYSSSLSSSSLFLKEREIINNTPLFFSSSSNSFFNCGYDIIMAFLNPSDLTLNLCSFDSYFPQFNQQFNTCFFIDHFKVEYKFNDIEFFINKHKDNNLYFIIQYNNVEKNCEFISAISNLYCFFQGKKHTPIFTKENIAFFSLSVDYEKISKESHSSINHLLSSSHNNCDFLKNQQYFMYSQINFPYISHIKPRFNIDPSLSKQEKDNLIESFPPKNIGIYKNIYFKDQEKHLKSKTIINNYWDNNPRITENGKNVLKFFLLLIKENQN